LPAKPAPRRFSPSCSQDCCEGVERT
jgi:hypothetical protein